MRRASGWLLLVCLSASVPASACSSTAIGTGAPGERRGQAPADPSVGGPVGAPGKRVFVTSGSYPADFATLERADATCYGVAKLAGLDGEWVAFLDDGQTGLARRIPNVGPWYARRVDAQGVETWHAVFANTANLHEPIPNATLDTDERGRTVSGGAWTGTREDGSSDPFIACGGWVTGAPADPRVKGEIGFVGFRNKEWRAAFLAACSESHHLYCFER